MSTTKTEEEFEEEPDEKERIFWGGRDRIRDSDTPKTCALLCFKKTLKNRRCHCFPRSKQVRGVTTYWKNMELLLKILTSPIKGGETIQSGNTELLSKSVSRSFMCCIIALRLAAESWALSMRSMQCRWHRSIAVAYFSEKKALYKSCPCLQNYPNQTVLP